MAGTVTNDNDALSLRAVSSKVSENLSKDAPDQSENYAKLCKVISFMIPGGT